MSSLIVFMISISLISNRHHYYPYNHSSHRFHCESAFHYNGELQLDPVGSTVRYEMMKLCTGSVEDIHAFIYCKKWRSGQVLPMPD